jgi:3-dehydroquinate dehydratase-2
MLMNDVCDEVPIVDYPSLLELCKDEARDAGFTRCDCYQSNHEGDLIDRVQDAYGMYEAMIINPGQRNVLSPALCEAIHAVGISTVVVNLFEPPATPFPYDTEDKNIERIAGKGVDGYRLAIERLAQQL